MSHAAVPDSASYPWLSARARNAMRRRALISIASGVTFLIALLGLVTIPRQATRVARRTASRVAPRPDTGPAIVRQSGATSALERIDTALASARRSLLAARETAPPQPVDTLSPALRAERDSLTALLAALTSAMDHAAAAPLPPSFRALAQSSALQGDPHVRVWLDSLNQVDKLRVPFGALGAGDPIYVALTARMNELGRSIRDAATAKRSELRARLAPLVPQPVALPVAVTVDTAQLLARRAAAAQALFTATRALDSMRAQNAGIDAALEHARELANLGAPPAAMLAAAFVVALAFGFGVAFVNELRNPRVAHVRETERVAGVRVLSVIRPTEVVERGRRQSDLDAPPLVDIVSESYRTLYLHLAATGASVPIITVTGSSSPIVATVATNLAAAAAYEARSTLLVDVDAASNAVASVLRIPSNPGLVGVLAGRATLPEAIVSTTIGRDRPLDVLPSGVSPGRAGAVRPELIAAVCADFTRMERRYDFIVISALVSYVQLPVHTVIPVPDVIVCAHAGETPLAELHATVRSLRGVGRQVHGIVLWDDEIPRLSSYVSRG